MKTNGSCIRCPVGFPDCGSRGESVDCGAEGAGLSIGAAFVVLGTMTSVDDCTVTSVELVTLIAGIVDVGTVGNVGVPLPWSVWF